jgi:DNA-binding LacI/PurR family transcriptional regulator
VEERRCGAESRYKELVTASYGSASKPVTLDEVARVAGVSRATVSRVVNGVATVDEGMRQVVEQAISSTGYRPNQAARSLVTRRAGSIALMLPEQSRMIGDPFFVQVVSGVTGVVRATGVHLVLMMADADTSEHVLADVRQGRLDGVILIYTHHDDPLPGLLIEANLPVVMSGRPDRPLSISYVDVNQIAGAALVADHLVARGRRRIATISGPADSTAGQDRLAGFLDAMFAHGNRDVVVVEGDYTSAGGAAAMERLLIERPDVDGIFVASDLMAQGGLTVLRRHGRRVPDDIAVVGFDDSSAALSCDPPLTTVRQPVEEMAAEMARLLLKQVERPDVPVSSVIFEPTLVVRGST